jgi:hypothetical protein
VYKKLPIVVVAFRKKLTGTLIRKLSQKFSLSRKISRKRKFFIKASAQNENFLENLSRKQKLIANFSPKTKIFPRNEISRKLAHFCLIFAFRENEKTVFVLTLGGTGMQYHPFLFITLF